MLILSADSEDEEEKKLSHPKKLVQKSSFASAFKSIMNKSLTTDQDPILAKYKKPEKEIEEEKKKEKEEKEKRKLKTKIRLMGRYIP